MVPSGAVTRYRRDPAWAVRHQDDGLIVHGGADAVYLIPGVVANTWNELDFLRDGAAFGRGGLSVEADAVVEQLLTVGVVRREDTPGNGGLRRVQITIHGEADPGVVPAIQAALQSTGITIVDDAPDLHVIVRTGGRLAGMIEVTREWDGPHILLDLAYQHTVSLGPLVFPGDSACLGCLAGRIGSTWGDATAPPQPAALGHLPLGAALLASELVNIAGGGLSLINRTVAYDVAAHRVEGAALYRVPGCAYCDAHRQREEMATALLVPELLRR